ncbi:MAG: glycine/betaine ABC transporter substrate-binding protein [Mogibacterium sp.]|nr:glycine/betaine ABC transporter substrate-binding protein [Mogibacterium sp.]
MKKRLCALLAIVMVLAMTCAGCGGSSSGGGDSEVLESGTIRIATKPMTEQFILSEMLKLVIEENTPYDVEITKGIGGGTNNIMPAMENGDFDLYPEYTSSGYVMVLDLDPIGVSDEEIWETLHSQYAEKFDMSWVGEYGFNNTFAVAVRKEVADQYKLKTTSELAPVSGELVFGGNPDYIEREDGFNTLCKTYGLNFKEVKDIDIGLKYEAISRGEIDVTNGFTTDAQLSNDDVAVLEDDKHLQVNYFCSTVVRNDALAKYAGLEEAIHMLDNSISDQEMAELNARVEINGENEADVAKDYLTEKGIL